MPTLGAPELLIVLLIIVLLFGFKRLPDAARSIGKSARIFKAEVGELKAEDQARKSGTSVGELPPSPAAPSQPAGHPGPVVAGTAGSAQQGFPAQAAPPVKPPQPADVLTDGSFTPDTTIANEAPASGATGASGVGN